MPLLRYYQRTLDEFLDRYRGTVVLLSAFFVIGVVFGALAVRSLEGRDKQELVAYMNSALPGLTAHVDGAGAVLFKRALLGRLKILAVLWALGISLVGIPGVVLLSFLRGLLSGFTVAFLAAEMGAGGVALAVAGHLPQSLLEVPALILAGTAAVGFSLQVIRSWRERRRVPHFYPTLATYTVTLLAMGLIMVLGCLVESYLSPVFVRFAASFVQAL